MDWADIFYYFCGYCALCIVAEKFLINRDQEKLTWTRRPGGDESIIYEHTREGRTISVSRSSVNTGMVSAMGTNGSQSARERQRQYAEDHRMYELEDGTSGRRKARRSTTVG